MKQSQDPLQANDAEFLKLDEIDRKVLFWLIDNVPTKSVKAWIEYISHDYVKRKAAPIDTEKLLREVQ